MRKAVPFDLQPCEPRAQGSDRTRNLEARGLTRIALVGPDGVGKSTTIALIRDWFERQLPDFRVEVRRWRPGLLPDLGWFIGKPSVTVKAAKPRRKGGKGHGLRVFYYYWDFLLGACWKDRIKTPQGTVVIYDRCALDMKVDPVRFGLNSARGTDLLCRLTPKPDLVVLLDDEPESICQRKQELEEHEVASQLDHWRRLAEAGEVHAIIRIDAEPEEIAARIQQLIVDTIVRKTHTRKAWPLPNPLQSLEGVMGSLGSKEFAVLPSGSNPRFLVPLFPLCVAAKSLDILNPQRFVGRAWRKCLSLALGTGVARHFPLSRRSLAVGKLEEFLAAAVGYPEVAISASLGRGGIHGKPVFQVMRPDGRIVGYAKLGWNDSTARLVRNEEFSLRRFEGTVFSTAIVPRVLHAGWFRGSYVLVQEAVAGTTDDSPWEPDQRHMAVLRDLAATSNDTICATPEIASRLSLIRQLGFDYYAYLLEHSVRYCDRRLHGVRVPRVAGHGDFAPWNIRTTGGKLLLLDWEYAQPGPAAFDLFHFLIGAATELKRQSATQIYTDLTSGRGRRCIQEYFDALKMPLSWAEPLLVSWITEKLSRNLVVFGDSPSGEDQISRRVLATLIDLMVNARRYA